MHRVRPTDSAQCALYGGGDLIRPNGDLPLKPPSESGEKLTVKEVVMITALTGGTLRR